MQALGSKGEPVLNFVTVLQRLVFKILTGIMWLAPIGAFGAIAGVVGNAGWAAIGALGLFVLVFYATCVVFVVVILGALLKVTTGFTIFKVLYYLRQEYLLIVATSSSETALPRLIAKMEHIGISKPVVGIVRGRLHRRHGVEGDQAHLPDGLRRPPPRRGLPAEQPLRRDRRDHRLRRRRDPLGERPLLPAHARRHLHPRDPAPLQHVPVRSASPEVRGPAGRAAPTPTARPA